MKNMYEWIPYIAIVLGSFYLGWLGHVIYRANTNYSIPISQTAIMEINLACSGNFRDLAANRQYVYANCAHPNFKPVTVQNYKFK